jgi:hypothetical protein
MANISLDDSFLTINFSLTQLDTLVESIGKANALTHVILAADLDIGLLHISPINCNFVYNPHH